MNMQYAGGGSRFLAAIIDSIIVGLVSFVLGAVLGIFMGEVGAFLNIILNIAITIFYWVFYQASQGQTLGKKAMKIKVVDVSGNKPTAMTFFLREMIGKFVSLLLLIGYLMILWDAKKQGLHDKIAGTVVIKVEALPIAGPVTNTPVINSNSTV